MEKLNIFIKKNLKYILAAMIIAASLVSVWFYLNKTVIFKKADPTTFEYSNPDSRPEEIKGKIVTLKRLRPEYFAAYHKMISNKLITKPFYYPVQPSFRFIAENLKARMKREAKRKTFFYVIFDNKDNKLIGAIHVREDDPNKPIYQQEEGLYRGQFGCWINPKYWGGGRIKEATKLITKEYFKIYPNKPKFEAHVELWNVRSFYALKKAGFKFVDFYRNKKGEKERYVLEFYNPSLK